MFFRERNFLFNAALALNATNAPTPLISQTVLSSSEFPAECFASLTGELCCRTARTVWRPLVRTRRYCHIPRLISTTSNSTTDVPIPLSALVPGRGWWWTIKRTFSRALTDEERTSWILVYGIIIWCWKQRTPRWRTPLTRCLSASGSKDFYRIFSLRLKTRSLGSQKFDKIFEVLHFNRKTLENGRVKIK